MGSDYVFPSTLLHCNSFFGAISSSWIDYHAIIRQDTTKYLSGNCHFENPELLLNVKPV